MTLHGLDTGNHAVHKNSTARFRQNNIYSNNYMVTENRSAAYAISQLQCAVEHSAAAAAAAATK